MRLFKKIISIVLFLLTINILIFQSNNVKALEENGENDEDLFPTVYSSINSEFRACWVSPLVSDIPRFSSETQYKAAYMKILDNMQKLNLNVIIFHVRIMNDALYQSIYSNWSSYYNTNPSWDALPWLIEEAHSRGIEFHAWMNPYRVTSVTSSNLKTLASKFKKSNPASNANNLLVGDEVIILDPGIPSIQSFLVNVCMELIENYDVDAIHFDDYFYAKGVDDSHTYVTYGSGQGIANFRRESVDNFIKMLSKRISKYNIENNKAIQLGISPTPVWKNGDGIVTYDDDGKAITTGSATKEAQSHYDDYLYCDTLKWINEEWIDYIIPQCYIGLTNGNNNFKEEILWWSKVCKNKPCRFYAGIGLYRAGSNHDWVNQDELLNEFDYMASCDGVDGFSIFCYKNLVNSNVDYTKNISNAAKYFEDLVLQPTTKRFELDQNKQVNNAYIINESGVHAIYFSKEEDVKYYLIVRETFDETKLIALFNSSSDVIEYRDELDSSYKNVNYYLASVGDDNKIGEFSVLKASDVYYQYKFLDGNNNLILTKVFKDDEEITYPEVDDIEGYVFDKWEKISDDTFQAKYEKIEYKVSFYANDELIKEEIIAYQDNLNLTLIPQEIEGYSFIGWKYNDNIVSSLNDIKENIRLDAFYEVINYKITFVNEAFDEINFNINNIKDIKLTNPEKEGFKFLGWFSEDDQLVSTIELKNYNLVDKWEEIKEQKTGCEKGIVSIYMMLSLLGIIFIKKRRFI